MTYFNDNETSAVVKIPETATFNVLKPEEYPRTITFYQEGKSGRLEWTTDTLTYEGDYECLGLFIKQILPGTGETIRPAKQGNTNVVLSSTLTSSVVASLFYDPDTFTYSVTGSYDESVVEFIEALNRVILGDENVPDTKD